MAGTPRYVAVCGESDPATIHWDAALEVGRLLAESRAVVLCGGMTGVMEAASRGVAEAGGIVVGILPGDTRAGANAYLTVALPTGMSQARNALIATAAESMIAIGRSWGTLSEVALARRLGRRVVSLASWELEGLEMAETPAQAVRMALA